MNVEKTAGKTAREKTMAYKKFFLVLVFGMTIVGCDTDNNNGNDNESENGNGNNNESGNGNGNSNGGTFILTNIPSEFEGKYALLNAFPDGDWEDYPDFVIVGMNYNPSAGTQSLVRIVNGKVSLPLWIQTFGESGSNIKRYSGNDTVEVMILIWNSASPVGSPIGEIHFEIITFSNGKVTVSWDDGDFNNYGSDE